jgi:hypothetical protein
LETDETTIHRNDAEIETDLANEQLLPYVPPSVTKHKPLHALTGNSGISKFP